MKFCSHIQSQIKQTKQRIAQKKIEEKMTAEERSKEREIQRQQLEDIFRVMEGQKEMFGVSDVSDVQEQLKMYIQWELIVTVQSVVLCCVSAICDLWSQQSCTVSTGCILYSNQALIWELPLQNWVQDYLYQNQITAVT